MKDLTIRLDHRPGALAALGETFGAAGINVEGGGAFAAHGDGIAHFLVSDEHAVLATRALADAGIDLIAVREVVVQRLDQARPGQLGLLTRRMADAGVDIDALYSDHEHRLILLTDEPARARAVAAQWMRDAQTAPS